MKTHLIVSGPEPFYVPHSSVGKYLVECLQQHGSRIAQVDAVTGETTTFESILRKSLLVAEHLHAHGIKHGDVVGICSENRLEFCLPVLAALYLGATCAPLNPMYTSRELQHAANISKPSIIFCSPAVVEKIANLANQLECIKAIVVFGGDHVNKYMSFQSFLREVPLSFQLADVNPDTDVLTILCSSGTTGLPKGVMITHKNVLVTVGFMRDFRFGTMKPSNVVLGLLPFFHAYAFFSQLCLLAIGLKIIILPKFEEHLFLKAIQNHKVNVLYVVPPLLVFLGKHPLVNEYDLSCIEEIWCGAAPLSREVQEQVTRRLGVTSIRQGYGMTETTLAVLLSPPHMNKYGSSGRLVPGTQCKVVDLESGEILGPGKNGELCFRGLTIMKGYCGDRQATSGTIDQDGFLHTGDIGHYDTDGYFFIVDRLKELIKYKGFQVPPAELESVLLLNPLIKDAAVIGVADDVAGELPLAFVVKQPGADLSPDDVIQFVSSHVSPQKRLHGGVMFVDAIPKTASGKILRRNLRSMIKSKL